MKKIYLFAILAAAALVSCSKTESVKAPEEGEFVTMTVNVDVNEALTRVKFIDPAGNKYPMKWGASDERIRVYERKDNASWPSSPIRSNASDYTPSSDYATASFKVSLPASSASLYDYWIVYPGGANNYGIGSGDSSNYLNIVRMGTNSTPQVPTATSPDVNYMFLVAAQTGLTAQPTAINADFQSVSSFGKMTVKGLSASSVSNIRITFENKSYVTGFIDYRVDTDTPTLTKSNSWSKNYIDINPKNISINSTSFDVWFGIAVQTISAGETVTVAFTTPSGDITKTFTIPSGKTLDFKRGHIVGFSVDMTGLGVAKVLTFDFSSNADGKFYTAYKSRTAIGKKATVVWKADDGNDYTFNNAGGCYFNTNRLTLYEPATDNAGYFGLPAIPGYRLVAIKGDRTNNTGAEVQLEITSASPKTTDSESLTGSITWAKGVANPATINLTGTAVNTMYYMHSLNAKYVPFNALELTYSPE